MMKYELLLQEDVRELGNWPGTGDRNLVLRREVSLREF